MSTLEIEPIMHPLSATVRVPGSKSLTNRALLIAALADGRTTLTNALFSDDSRYFAQALAALGFVVARRRSGRNDHRRGARAGLSPPPAPSCSSATPAPPRASSRRC